MMLSAAAVRPPSSLGKGPPMLRIPFLFGWSYFSKRQPLVHLLENDPSSPVGELAQLESTLQDVLEMLDRVLAYAQEAAGGKPADAALGRYLMDALGGGVEELGKSGFTSNLQVRSFTPGIKELRRRCHSDRIR
jgi:hypothetical protein